MLEPLNHNGYVVHLSEDAVIDLCLAGMEAHIVEERRSATRSKGNRLETFGLLWGGVSKMSDGRTLIYVSKASTDTTALRTKDSVTPSKSAFLLKKDLITSFWPELNFLGDFHTHPYDEEEYLVRDIEENRLFEFSDGDISSISGSKARRRFWAQHGFILGIVATILKMQRLPWKRTSTSRRDPIVFNLGHYRIWMKAYVGYLQNGEITLSGHRQRNIQLYCPWVSGCRGPLTAFGREKTPNQYVPGQI
jgi:hypothetical protein